MHKVVATFKSVSSYYKTDFSVAIYENKVLYLWKA